MSDVQEPDSNQNDTKNISLEFFITPEHECPYLPEQTTKTLFLSPDFTPNVPIYSLLINKGFRRSGDHIYRPHCDSCKACISARIPIAKFEPNKQQKRCMKKGQLFTTSVHKVEFDSRRYELFERYINTRHTDGDMYPTSEKQYKDFVLCQWMNGYFLDFTDKDSGKLVASCVFDQLQNGLSAVYTFFDPDYSKFSPGRLAVLGLIEQSKKLSLDFVYLGYWIKNCQKMAYKGEYRPIECFVDEQWVLLT